MDVLVSETETESETMIGSIDTVEPALPDTASSDTALLPIAPTDTALSAATPPLQPCHIQRHPVMSGGV